MSAENPVPSEGAIPTPFESPVFPVRPEWIDHNGHMNVAYYLLAFDESVWPLFHFLGLTREYRRENRAGTFVGDYHIRYVRELMEGQPVRVTHQLVDADAKRVHFCQAMYHADEGWLAAQSEVISLHVDMRTRRVAPMPATMVEHVARVVSAHAALPRPDNLGRTIGIRRR